MEKYSYWFFISNATSQKKTEKLTIYFTTLINYYYNNINIMKSCYIYTLVYIEISYKVIFSLKLYCQLLMGYEHMQNAFFKTFKGNIS